MHLETRATELLFVFVVAQSPSWVQLFVTHGLQQARLPCPSLSPGVCSNSCSLTWWCYSTISFSAALFSFCLQSFPASGSFPMSWPFPSGNQSIGASASASAISPSSWLPLGLTGLISLQSKGLSRIFFSPQFESINSLMLFLLYGPTLTSIYDCWKKHSFDYRHLCQQRNVSAFYMLSKFVIVFPRSKCPLIS